MATNCRSAPAAASNGLFRLWDVATGKQKAVLTGDTGVRCVALSPDGKLLAGGGEQGAGERWSSSEPFR